MKWLAKLIHAPDKKERHYVSDADKLLHQFDAVHPQRSASQTKEVQKHADIFNRTTSSRINWN